MRKGILLLSLILITIATRAAVVDTINVYSPSMKKNVRCVVFVPDDSLRPMPTVYLLHGYGNNYSQWPRVAPQLSQQADRMHLLIICPDGGKASWYFDSPVDSTIRYETFMSTELIAYIDSHYHSINNRNARAITGLSMGGHGGLYLGIRHKNVFGAAGSISGVMEFPPIGKEWQPDSSVVTKEARKNNWQQNTVLYQSETLKNGELKIIFDCGVNDFLLHVNRKLHQKLLDRKIDHDYTERPGRHDSSYWKNSIDFQLLFFSKYFNQNLKTG